MKIRCTYIFTLVFTAIALFFFFSGCRLVSHCSSYKSGGKKQAESKSPFTSKTFSLFGKKSKPEQKSPFASKAFSFLLKKNKGEQKSPFTSKTFSFFSSKNKSEQKSPFSTRFFIFSKRNKKEERSPFASRTSASQQNQSERKSPFSSGTFSIIPLWLKDGSFNFWGLIKEKSPFESRKKKQKKKSHENGLFPHEMWKK